MRFEKWFESYAPTAPESLDDCALAAFQAGAASRDAEIQRLQMALADAEALELGTAEKCDQLRAQINVLRGALSSTESALDESRDYPVTYDEVITALITTPEQSIARLRNQVREDIAREFDGEVWAYDYREIAARIRAMKEPE